MPTEFKIPNLGDGIKGGDVLNVLVKVGDTVAKDQSVLELETDKATIEVPSSEAGTVAEIKVKSGDKVTIGQVVLTLDEGAASAAASAPSPSQPAAPAAPEPPAASAPSPSATANQAPPAPAAPAAPAAGSGEPVTFNIPNLGDGIKGGDVLNVLVKVGDTVAVDQSVVELETDKATIEVPSSVAGTVTEVKVKAGDKVTVGQAVLVLSGGAAAPAPAQPAAASPAAQPAEAASPAPNFGAKPAASGAKAGPAEVVDISRGARPAAAAAPAPAPAPDNRPAAPAAPSVRRLARQLGIDIHGVTGSGAGGRISADDVLAHGKRLITTAPTGGGSLPAVVLPDFSKWGAIERQPMRAIRRKTAEHMVTSWTSVPHVTQHEKADVTDLEALRQKFGKALEAQTKGKLTVTAVALKVAASALKAFPQVNASVDMAGEAVIYKQYVHIGVAVDTDRGLLVPVIRDVDKKGVLELAVELAQLAEKARNGKLTLDEMQGGCFTITNLGGIGGTSFTPIVNQPEAAILGMSRSRTEPVWQDGQFVPRLMLPLSLSYDHRIVDGADGIRFLRYIVDRLEHPFLLSL
jgi:pyruvate dehydrogenase E2 component (dihydrolipoamide acetyltransferase)